MGWKQEHKEYMNQKYSAYVQLCRKLGKEFKPYYAFELKDLENLKNENRLRNS